MNPFVRFIFTIILIGVALNLGIVLLANAHSQRIQLRDMADEKIRFDSVIARFNNRQRRGDIAVEWQKTDAINRRVVETSLLVRMYSLDNTGERIPLPIIHVVIPGNRVSVDGTLFQFQPGFTDAYAELRDVRLAYFNHIYGETQPVDDRFTLLRPYEPPLSTRLDFDRVTRYEIQFWHYVWDLSIAGHDPNKTLLVTQTPSSTRTVVPGLVYSIFISNFDTSPSITESTDAGLLYELSHESANENAEREHAGSTNGNP